MYLQFQQRVTMCGCLLNRLIYIGFSDDELFKQNVFQRLSVDFSQRN